MVLQLELRHYETVLAIVELGTMTAAAKALSTSQSALSHRLAEAERRLGTTLFERGPQRRLKPTRAGFVIHQAASRALADLERSEALLLSEREGVVSTVRIAVGSYDCFHWYPEFLRTARANHPEIEVNLVAGIDRPEEALASGNADLVLAPGHPSGPISLHPLFEDELVLLVAPDHPLAPRDFVEPEELSEETYLTYNLSPAPGFEYDRFIRPAAAYPRIVTVVQQTSAIAELVAAGSGVSILSRWALLPVIDAGRVVPVRCGTHGLSLRWHAAIRASEAEGSPARRIADELSSHLATI